MSEKNSTPPERRDPLLDPSQDTGEPAFDWMKPAPAAEPPATETPAASPGSGRSTSATLPEDTDRPAGSPASGRDNPAGTLSDTPVGTPSETAPVTPAGAPDEARDDARDGAPAVQPESRADRKAAEAAGGTASAVREPVYNETLRTSALHIRPPEEEVERRNAEREQAAKARPLAPRIMQILLAVFFPVVLLVLAVRAVTSPVFLWIEYNRPGFPGDGYGFSTDDRMTYGSYAVDYLTNFSGPRYLGELVNRNGDALFKSSEVSHMADVKLVILLTFAAGALLVLLSLIAVIYLRRRSPGGVRRGLFAGSIVTLAIIIGLGVLATLGWEQFFTEFHRLFFASGTWTFALQDTLIRLFPSQFWIDAGIGVGALVLIASLLTLILTWPTRRRRGRATAEQHAREVADAGTDAGTAAGTAEA